MIGQFLSSEYDKAALELFARREVNVAHHSSMEEADTSQSLAALEYRLHRLEHYIAGSSDVGSMPCPTQDQSAHARIARLERGLNGLESRSSTIRQLLQLRRHGAPKWTRLWLTKKNRNGLPRALPPFNSSNLHIINQGTTSHC